MKNLECEKEYLERNVSCLIQEITKCFEQRYSDLMNKAYEDTTNTVKETTEGDRLLSLICKVQQQSLADRS